MTRPRSISLELTEVEAELLLKAIRYRRWDSKRHSKNEAKSPTMAGRIAETILSHLQEEMDKAWGIPA